MTLQQLTKEEYSIVLSDYPKHKGTVCTLCRQALNQEQLILVVLSQSSYFNPVDYVHKCPYCNCVTELDQETLEEFNSNFYN